MNYYRFHIGDFNNATRHLTRVERSLYRDLIDLYYDTERPLTNDIEKLCRRILCGDEDKNSLRDVLNEFFVLREDGYHNARCDYEIDSYKSKREKASMAGKASAKKRSTSVQRSFNVRSTSVSPVLNQPITNNQEPITKNQDTKKENKKKESAVAPPDGVSSQVWEDFCKLRLSKRSGVTQTALLVIEREAKKASWSLEQALCECCARGWISFKAEWIRERREANASRASPETFRERDARMAAQRIAQFAPSIADVPNVVPFVDFVEEVKNVDVGSSH